LTSIFKKKISIMNFLALIVLALFVAVRAQQQPAKPQVEPVPHSEQHSPGNPPPAGSPPTATNVLPNANNTNVGLGGNTLTNVAVPKAEPPSPNAEPKPKSEPPSAADHDHDHAHDHEHSPGNPKHAADNNLGGGVGNVQAQQFLIILATLAPLALSFLAANL
jgi:ABC-type nickel/cobalt efflux system permease component RcnA